MPFSERGHQVIRHGDVLSPGDKDTQVVVAAIMNKAILIAMDRDMKQMAKRFGSVNDGGRYPNLNLIFLNCNGVIAPKRLEHALTLIEHEWQFTCEKPTRRLWIDIGLHHISSYR